MIPRLAGTEQNVFGHPGSSPVLVRSKTNAKHLTAEERQNITIELERLRKRRTGLYGASGSEGQTTNRAKQPEYDRQQQLEKTTQNREQVGFCSSDAAA